MVFKKTIINLDNLLFDIKIFISSYIVHVRVCGDMTISLKTARSLVDHILFLDASVKDIDLGTGIVWCSLAGLIEGVKADFDLVSEAQVGEATALFLAISWAQHMNISKVLLVSDCHNIVRYVNCVSRSVSWRSKDLLNICKACMDFSAT